MAMKTFEHPPRTTGRSKQLVAAVLWSLALEGPVIDKPGGHAADILLKRLQALGYDMSINALNRIINALGDREHSAADTYPYDYITRDVGKGKRTFEISLKVNPKEVPFPPNPFKRFPQFQAVNELPPPPEIVESPAPEQEETFARQRMFDGDMAAPPPEPAPLPVAELAIEPEPMFRPEDLATTGFASNGVSAALEPYVPAEATVRNNGDHGDEDDLFPADLFAESGLAERSSMELISKAIATLSEAMTAHANEQIVTAAGDVQRQIDERLGEYRLLRDRCERAENKLAGVVANYRRVVELARKQRGDIISLQKENQDLRLRAAGKKVSV